MRSPAFRAVNGQPNGNIMGDLQALMSNPVDFLARRKLNLPQNFQGGPEDIVNYWLNNGTMSREQFSELQGRVNQMIGQK